MITPPVRRCAIYTRKSSEEGLEQDFNSLHAQREACEAYIKSQQHEGWQLVEAAYDDGGYSGGSMNRPALQQLMTDIQAGKIDSVVVYKIDRLTRSLMDFAKLVDVFDKHRVTFVSITQSFNTTTSMGRLTLNVLLSFAQFEREVTGERIRDKMAASRKKGLWMGGVAPLGYRVVEKKLVVDEASAPFVVQLFEQYLTLGSVRDLKEALDAEGITSRLWTSRKERAHGGASFSRGILYKILRNPVYIGQVSHKGVIYNGQHDGIIPKPLWAKVQAQFEANAARPRGKRTKQAASAALIDLLKGKLFDPNGCPYSPTYSMTGKKQYRYYISQNLLQHRALPQGILARLPAPELEQTVLAGLGTLISPLHLNALFGLECSDASAAYLQEQAYALDSTAILSEATTRITLTETALLIELTPETLKATLEAQFLLILPSPITDRYTLNWPYRVNKAQTGFKRIDPAPTNQHATDDPFDRSEEEMRRWLQGIVWREAHFRGTPIMQIAKKEGLSATHVQRCIMRSLTINSIGPL